MNKTEKELFLKLTLERRSKVCNDLDLPNTPEYRELAINALNYSADELDEPEELIERIKNATGETFCTYDFIVLAYLRDKIDKHFDS